MAIDTVVLLQPNFFQNEKDYLQFAGFMGVAGEIKRQHLHAKYTQHMQEASQPLFEKGTTTNPKMSLSKACGLTV